MTAKERRRDLSERADALIDLVREQSGYISAPKLAEGERKLRRRVAESQPGSRTTWSRLILPSAAVVALGIGALLAWENRVPRSLAFTGDGAELHFSDGTDVAFLSGATGHIESIDSHGARLRLHEGMARVQVVHLPGAHWLFDAGPFLITVTGTSFTADWNRSDECLTVRLEKGSVAVNGPLSEDPIMLHEAQKLTVRVREKETLITAIDAPAPLGTAAPAASASASEPVLTERELVDPGAAARQANARGAASGMSWSAELARGQLDSILENAERRGIEAVLAEASSNDLAALADAARYRRRNDLARQALTAQRRRFAHTSRAQDAGFLLGRLDEAGGDVSAALAWYGRYLEEAPTGTYAAEALGRRMTIVQRKDGELAARPLADEYLRRFPAGPYVATAQAILRRP